MTIFAQQTGSLAGKVVDAATGEALPGVNVILKGTYYGAATNINGNFRIDNISIGNYNVDISLIGYKTFQFTSISIEANKTTQLDVELEETDLTLEQDVVVIGAKP
jgi:predicted nicotinamide N-methyase